MASLKPGYESGPQLANVLDEQSSRLPSLVGVRFMERPRPNLPSLVGIKYVRPPEPNTPRLVGVKFIRKPEPNTPRLVGVKFVRKPEPNLPRLVGIKFVEFPKPNLPRLVGIKFLDGRESLTPSPPVIKSEIGQQETVLPPVTYESADKPITPMSSMSFPRRFSYPYSPTRGFSASAQTTYNYLTSVMPRYRIRKSKVFY